MKKILLLAALVVLGGTLCFAQNHSSKESCKGKDTCNKETQKKRAVATEITVKMPIKSAVARAF